MLFIFQRLRATTLAVMTMEDVNTSASHHQMGLVVGALKASFYVKPHLSVPWLWVRLSHSGTINILSEIYIVKNMMPNNLF